jgi:hypothetical protein
MENRQNGDKSPNLETLGHNGLGGMEYSQIQCCQRFEIEFH